MLNILLLFVKGPGTLGLRLGLVNKPGGTE